MDYKKIVISGPGPNALSPDSLARLSDALDDAGDRPIVLTGEGRAFSAGLDLTALVTMNATDFESFLTDLEAFAHRLFLHPAPTVAVLNGHCVAAGYMIAAACEHRVAASRALKVGLPAVKLGLQYPPTLLAIIRYVIPVAYHEEVLLGSQAHASTKGLAMGMIDEIAAEDEMARGLEWLEARASLPRDAYAATKRTLREDVVQISDAERTKFREQVVPSWADPERIQRMLKAIGK